MKSDDTEFSTGIKFEDSITYDSIERFGYDTFNALKRNYELLKVERSRDPRLFRHSGFWDFSPVLKEMPKLSADKKQKKKLDDFLQKSRSEAEKERERFWSGEYGYFKKIEDSIAASGEYDPFCTFLSKTMIDSHNAFRQDAALFDTDKHFYAYTKALFMFHEKLLVKNAPEILLSSINSEFGGYIGKPNEDESILRKLLFEKADEMSLPALFGAIRFSLGRETPIDGMLWLGKITPLVEKGLSRELVSELIKKKMGSNGFSRAVPRFFGGLYLSEMGILDGHRDSGLYMIGFTLASCYNRDYLYHVRSQYLHYFDGELVTPKSGRMETAMLYYRSIKDVYNNMRKQADDLLNPKIVFAEEHRRRRRFGFR